MTLAEKASALRELQRPERQAPVENGERLVSIPRNDGDAPCDVQTSARLETGKVGSQPTSSHSN